MQRDVFHAIADPTRREIIDLLAGKSLTVNDVAEQFEISRPAISRHIRILKECGVVVVKKKGRKSYCRTNVRELKKVTDWTNRYRKFWSEKLDALEAFLSDESGEPGTTDSGGET